LYFSIFYEKVKRMDHTIAAISTGAPGGIGIVRVSGKEAWNIGRKILDWKGTEPKSRVMHLAKICAQDGEVIDQGLFVLMHGPNSYTGEDLLELHCHGGTVVLSRVLERCLEAGAQMAKPGEFTQRAFLNGRLDLTQAEAVNDLIHAKTQRAASMAVQQLEGSLSRKLKSLRDRLLDLLAQIEGRLDFPDEIEDDLPPQLWEELAVILAEVGSLIAAGHSGQILREGLPVSIVGKPNVGKSSLLNALLGTQRAIVTSCPGTTRDVISESANICGIPVVLTDTAGIRQAEDLVEKMGVELAEQTAREAALVLLVLDGTCKLEEDHRELIQKFPAEKLFLLVNKCDLPLAITGEELEKYSPAPSFFISALTGEGLDELKEAIAEKGLVGGENQALLVNMRQREALYGAQRALEAALLAFEEALPSDLIAIDLRQAVEKLGEITGENLVEGLLERIFSNFCLGK
jgi:tRNA modification GTPase